jgi:hypothetical protein
MVMSTGQNVPLFVLRVEEQRSRSLEKRGRGPTLTGVPALALTVGTKKSRPLGGSGERQRALRAIVLGTVYLTRLCTFSGNARLAQDRKNGAKGRTGSGCLYVSRWLPEEFFDVA